MKGEDRSLLVLYFLVPLLLITTFLPLLGYAQQTNMVMQNQRSFLLFPKEVVQRTMGLMTPNPWPDAVASDYDDVKTSLNQIPAAYLKQDTVIGAGANEAKLQGYLTSANRAHISAHGRWDSGPIVVLSDVDLTTQRVNYWSYYGSICTLMILSACNSMGHGGTVDTTLAQAIMQKSNVNQVVGYKDVVDAIGAGMFGAFFWAHHLWENGVDGGEDSDSAFSDAKDDIYRFLSNTALQALLFATITSVVIAAVCGIVAVLFPEFPWLVGLIAGILIALISVVLFIVFMFALNSGYLGVAKYGTSVPGLTYMESSPPGGGGGGGGKPPVLTPF